MVCAKGEFLKKGEVKRSSSNSFIKQTCHKERERKRDGGGWKRIDFCVANERKIKKETLQKRHGKGEEDLGVVSSLGYLGK